MSRWRVIVETRETYEFDFEELKRLYSDEYAEWLENYEVEPDDERAWIAECFEVGGADVFPGHIGDTVDMEAERRR